MPYLAVLLITLFLGLQYKLWFGAGGIHELVSVRQQSSEQSLANQKLDAKNSSLVANIKELKNGDQALEEQARQTLGMVKDDEVYFQVVEKK